MAKYNNIEPDPKGIVNVDMATRSTLNRGGGVSVKENPDGSKHYSVYERPPHDTFHFSYNVYSNGEIKDVHTTNSNGEHITYKGGRKE